MAIIRIILGLIQAILKIFVEAIVNFGALLGGVLLAIAAAAGIIWVLVLVVLALVGRHRRKRVG